MKKGDKIIILIIVLLLGISSISVLLYKHFTVPSDHIIAKISKNGEVIKEIDLDKVKKTYEIRIDEDDTHYNVIQVEHGRIRFSEANCPDHVCVKTGWLSGDNPISVCLPHGLMIEIEGAESEIDELAH